MLMNKTDGISTQGRRTGTLEVVEEKNKKKERGIDYETSTVLFLYM